MTAYTKSTNFATKDTLTSGDPLKIVKGTEINTEFDNIATAVNSKSDTASPTFTGIVTAAALTTTGNTILGDASTDTLNVGNGGLVKDASGNVGIGTASPGVKLDVSGSNGNFIRYTSVGGVSSILGDNGGTLGQTGTTTNHPFIFLTNNTERMRIDSSGNVGIGVTSNGGYKFAVGGSGLKNQYITTDANNAYLYTDGSSYIGTTGAFNNVFITNNTERMRIDSSGNLLVGTTSLNSAERLSVVKANTGGVGIAYFSNTNNSSGDQVLRSSLGANANNTSSYHFVGNTGTDKIYIFGNGNIQNVNNSYGALSDLKLKENIIDATPKLEKLNQVRIVNFNMIGDKQKQIGVIAQELEQVFPSLIDETPDRDAEGNDIGTKTKSVKYSVFVPILIKAIQEQQAIISSLTDRITLLESK